MGWGAATPFRVRSHVSYYKTYRHRPSSAHATCAAPTLAPAHQPPKTYLSIIIIYSLRYTHHVISYVRASVIARVGSNFFKYFFFLPIFSRRLYRKRRVSRRRPRRQRSIFVPCPIAGHRRSSRPALTSSDYRQPYVIASRRRTKG